MLQRFFAAIGLILSLPLLAAIYPFVILTSSGPFLYRQQRPGLRGTPFMAYKIRSMRKGADRDPTLVRSVQSSHPQVTKVGKILRDLKLDEIPQLWNVIRGEMAFVGPRPIAIALYDELVKNIDGFEDRLTVHPGLTSLAQVCIVESEDQDSVIEDWKIRFEAESHYLANRSVTYDLIILMLTGMYLMKKLLSPLRGQMLRVSIAVVVTTSMLLLAGCVSTMDISKFKRHGPVLKRSLTLGPTPEHPAAINVESVKIPALSQDSPDRHYRIGPGDELTINVFGEPGASELHVRVDADGYIQLPILELVKVSGLNPTGVQKKLKNQYTKHFVNPWVVVVLTRNRSRPLYLLGEFNSPGVVYLEGPTNIVQALSYGKGLNDNAYLRGAHIIRDKNILPVDINAVLRLGRMEQNIWLEAGDTIFVPSINDQQVSILGAVNRVGPIPIGNNGLGLLEAITKAQGPQRGIAKLGQIRIIRTLSPVQGELILVDLEKILSGDNPDLPLAAGDIVYIPRNALGNWNDAIQAIKPSIGLISSSLQPFVQLKFLAGQ